MAEDPVVSLRMADGSRSSRPLWEVQARQVVRGVPWRAARSVRGQAHSPGFFWSATMSGHVIYESRLELARLLLADFDRDVTAIAAQPFLVQAQVDGRARRHVPDFLLVHADGLVRVVNVKPTARLADPAVAEALAWPGELFRQHGWEHEATHADRLRRAIRSRRPSRPGITRAIAQPGRQTVNSQRPGRLPAHYVL
jgi:hypothetical protein